MRALSGEVAVVTGAASGIGKAIALKYAEEGAQLAILDCADLEEVEREISRRNVECKSFSADVTDRRGLKEIFARVFRRYSKIDVLVNVAGICKRTYFLEMTDEEMDRTLDVNFKGVYNCARLVLPSMVEKRRGNIISISSVTGKTGAGMACAYAASKGAVNAFTKSLAREFGHLGIRVNAIAPGLIDTPIAKGIGVHGMEHFLERTPIMRMGNPDEIAEVAAFLASDASSYVTGQVWNVCGGYSMD